MPMKLHPAVHTIWAAICTVFLFTGKEMLAVVLYLVFVAVEIFVSAVTGKQGNDTER